jgi:Xaa-Pro aminopeptidase
VVAASGYDPDLASFAGSVHLGECLVALPRGGTPHLGYVTDMERGEAARTGLDLLPPSKLLESDGGRPKRGDRAGRFWSSALSQCGIEPGRLALAGSYPAGPTAAALAELAREGFEIVDFGAQMRRVRKAKTGLEVEEITRVAEATGRALRQVAAALAAASSADGALRLDGAALTAGRLRRIVRSVLLESGVSEPEGNIVSAGADAAVPHTAGADQRQLRAGETLVVDLFPRGTHFADCTRTFCVGEPSPAVAEAHALALRALREATAAARVGAEAPSLQERVCALFEAAGWDTPRSRPGTVRGYVHGLGHGVGLELHEQPTFRGTGPESRLEAGDVFTLEPGLYDPEAGFGIRLEDLFVLDQTGPVNLTPLPYDLDPRAW